MTQRIKGPDVPSPANPSDCTEPIRVALFGPFTLTLYGIEVPSLPRPVQELTAQLALAEPRGLSRSTLAESLWPDIADERALFYLRRSLSTLRSALGPERVRIVCDKDRVHLDLTDCSCDALKFQTLARQNDPASLRTAIDLYVGPFLMGNGSSWTRLKRSEFIGTLVGAISKLALGADAGGDVDLAAWAWRKAMLVEPSNEVNMCRLMSALARTGDFAGMVRQYRDFQSRLKHELGLIPSPQTTAHYRHLLTEAKLVAAHSAASSAEPPQKRVLPSPTTSFIGRLAEKTAISDALASHRIVTITGVGGVGKTRLATEVTASISAEYGDRIYLADLSEGPESIPVAEAVASAINVSGSDPSGTVATIEGHIGDRKTLLIIDDAERFVDQCASLVAELVARCPGLRVLCTTRRPMHIGGEFVIPVRPLPVPASKVRSIEQAMESEAVVLFIDRARASAPAFHLTDSNTSDVAEICRRLDGLPLALELAAVRLRSLSPKEILSRLESDYQMLGQAGGPVERHGTLEATLAWSFELLSPTEQDVFLCLSVFPGSWTVAAAVDVCANRQTKKEEIPRIVIQLVEHSLVEFDLLGQQGRYRLLDCVRSYAQNKLHEQGRGRLDLRLRHAEHFLQVAESPEFSERLHPIAENDPLLDGPNFSFAIESFLLAGDPEPLQKALRLVNALFPYWRRGGRLSEGLEISLKVVRNVKIQSSDELAEALFRAGSAAHELYRLPVANHLLNRAEAVADALGLEFWSTESLRLRGELAANQGRLEEAQALLGSAADRFGAIGDQRGVALSKGALGYAAKLAGNLQQAKTLTEEAMALHTLTGDSEGRLWCLGSLGSVYHVMGNYSGASAMFTEALAQHRLTGNLPGQAWNLGSLGEASLRLGDVDAAIGHLRQALEIHDAERDGLTRVWPLRVMGEALEKSGDLEGAEAAFQESLQLSRVADDGYAETKALIRLGTVRFARGDVATAAAYYRAASSRAESSQMADLDKELSDLAAKLQQPEPKAACR